MLIIALSTNVLKEGLNSPVRPEDIRSGSTDLGYRDPIRCITCVGGFRTGRFISAEGSAESGTFGMPGKNRHKLERRY